MAKMFDALRSWFARFGLGQRMSSPGLPVAPLVRVEPRRDQAAPPNDVFTPTRPRAGRRTLVGRQAELARILEAVLDETAHVVLYSERGRGKTSLSNLAIESLRRRGAIVSRCACEAESNFDTILHALARDLPPSLLTVQQAEADMDGCEGILPRRALRPADVAAIPQALDCPFVVFVVDEFDRVTDAETRTRLADTIKLLSDRGSKLYFMVVGVSDTLEQIIGQHPSIQRNIVPIHLPLLRDEEIAGMMTKGGQQAGIAFTEEAVRLVVAVARGMPYMAQLLGLRITQAALRRGDEQVQNADLLAAVTRLLDEASAGVLSTYAMLTSTGSEAGLSGLLNRLANAEQDQWGRMAVARAASHVVVGGRRLPGTVWSRLIESGVIVQPEGEGGLAQFRDRGLIYHIQLLAARAELTGDRLATGGLASAEAPTPRLRPVVTGASG